MMNETIQTLLTRRSIRSFRPEAIPQSTMESLIQAAKFAPTAMGLQDRHFTIVNDAKILDHIVEVAVKNGATFLKGHTPFYHAPSVVVVSAPENSRYGRENVACAIENLMLAAKALGLGTCYICSVLPGLQDEVIRKELKLSENYIPYGCVSVGYPAEEAPEPKPRRTDDVTILP